MSREAPEPDGSSSVAFTVRIVLEALRAGLGTAVEHLPAVCPTSHAPQVSTGVLEGLVVPEFPLLEAAAGELGAHQSASLNVTRRHAASATISQGVVPIGQGLGQPSFRGAER